jgi:RHS repeat-associated protein
VTARYSYDPFGQRRTASGSYDPDGALVYDWNNTNSGTDRGYTGHEHLDDVGIIHMNGRLYSQKLGVFLQTDPFIQDPANPQNFNRYGYCLNSPLTCSDPNGRFSIPLIAKVIIAILIAKEVGIIDTRTARMLTSIAIAATFGPGATFWEGTGVTLWQQAAISGFASGAIATGNVKGGLQGMFSSMAFYGVGNMVKGGTFLTPGLGGAASLPWEQGVALHAVAGCVTSAAGGGKCGSGALSAGFSKAFAGSISDYTKGNELAGTAMSAVVGGTAAALGGGKFANGATTGAFSYIYNWLAPVHKSVTVEGAEGSGMSRADAKALGQLVSDIDKLNDDGTLSSVFSADSQRVDHAHMHSMCAAGSGGVPACVSVAAEYIERSFEMKSMQGLAQILHLEQDYLSRGHQMAEYDGSVGLRHFLRDADPATRWPALVRNTTNTIIEYDNRCGGCIIKR